MPYDVDIGDGADALGQNQLTDALDGTYWVSGWDATLGTGDLEVDIAAGSGAVAGTDVSTGSTQTIDFTGDPDSTDPRKAVIYVDSGGTVQKALGTPQPVDPTGEIRFRTYNPSPPASVSGVVVAEVWLAAGETGLETADVRDRRVSNDAVESFETPEGFAQRSLGDIARLPAPRFITSGAGTSDTVVVAGGRGNGGATLDTTYRYNRLIDSWTVAATLPAAVERQAMAAANGSIYLFGGQDAGGVAQTTVYEYDPQADSWTTVAPLPEERINHAAATLDGLIYIIGGDNSSTTRLDTVYEYDPQADSWTTVAPLPSGRRSLNAAATDAKLYAAGGDSLSVTAIDTVYEYDPQADSWTTVAPLPSGRRAMSMFSVDNRIYVMGGANSGLDAQTTVYEYDPDVGAWITLRELAVAHESGASAALDSVGYVITGRDAGGTVIPNAESYARISLTR